MTSTYEEEIRQHKARYERIATELTNGYGLEALCDTAHYTSERLCLIKEIETLAQSNGVGYEEAIGQVLRADVHEYNTLAKRDDHSDGMMLSPDWSRYKELSNRIDFLNDLSMAVTGCPPRVHGARVYHQDCGRCQGIVYMSSAFGPRTLYQPTVYECKNPDCGKVTFTIDENDRHFYRDMNKLGRAVD